MQVKSLLFKDLFIDLTLGKLTQFEHHLLNLLLYSLYQNHIHPEQSKENCEYMRTL